MTDTEEKMKEKSRTIYRSEDIKSGNIRSASIAELISDPDSAPNPVFVTNSLKFAMTLAMNNEKAVQALNEGLLLNEIAPSWDKTMGPYQVARKKAKDLAEDEAKKVIENAEEAFIDSYEKHLDSLDWKSILDKVAEHYGDNDITIVSYEGPSAFSFRHAAANRLGFEKERRPYLEQQKALKEEAEKSREIEELKKELRENSSFDPNDIMSVARRNKAIKAGLIKDEGETKEHDGKRNYYIRNKKGPYATFISDDSSADVGEIKALLGSLVSSGYTLRIVPFGSNWRSYIPENSTGKVEYYGPLCNASEDSRAINAFEKYGKSFRSSTKDKCMLALMASLGEVGEKPSEIVIGLNEKNRRYDPVSFVARTFESINPRTAGRNMSVPVYYAAGRDAETAMSLSRILSSSEKKYIPNVRVHFNYATVFGELLDNPDRKGLEYTIDPKRENIRINAPILEALSVHYPHGSSPLAVTTTNSRMISLPKDVNTFEKNFVSRGGEDEIPLEEPVRVPVSFNITTLSRISYTYDYAVNPDPEIEELNYDMNAPAAGEQTSDENRVENTDVAAIVEIAKWGELHTQEDVDRYMENFLGVNTDGYNEDSHLETEYYVPLAQRVPGDEAFLTEGEFMAKLIKEAGAWEDLTKAYGNDYAPAFENTSEKNMDTMSIEHEEDLEM